MKLRPDFFRPRAFWILGEGNTVQGYVDLDDPDNLNLEYTQAIGQILNHLDFGNVVHIGGGGMSLPRHIHSLWPFTVQTVFEPDLDMIEFAGRVLKAFEGYAVVNKSGEEGMAKLPDGFTDLTIVDAFEGGTIPEALLSQDFFKDLYRTSHTVIFNTIQEGDIEIPVPEYAHKLMLTTEACMGGKERNNVLFVWSHNALPVQKIRESVVPYKTVEIFDT